MNLKEVFDLLNVMISFYFQNLYVVNKKDYYATGF